MMVNNQAQRLAQAAKGKAQKWNKIALLRLKQKRY